MKVPEANKTGFDSRIYVNGETKLCIKQNTQIVYNICGREAITQDIDRKWVTEPFVSVFGTKDYEFCFIRI